MKKKNKDVPVRKQWKYLFHMIRKSRVPWYLFILSLVMDALSANLFVQLPVMLGDIMNGEIYDTQLVHTYMGLSIGQVLLGYAAVLVFNFVSVKVDIASGVGIWKQIIQMPMIKLMKEKPSTLISRVSDDATGVGLALSGLFNSLSMIYTIIVVYVQMFQLDVRIAGMLLAVPVWLLVSMKIIGQLSYRTQRRIQDTLSSFTSYLSVRLPNMRMIKAFGTEEKEKKDGAAKIEEQYKAEVAMAEVNALGSVLQSLSTTLASLIVLVYGGVLVGRGQMEAGDLVSFYMFAAQGSFTSSAEEFLMYFTNIKIGLGACAKAGEMEEEETEDLEKGKSFTTAPADIRIQDVSFSYEPGVPVLKHVSFSIPKGKTTAVIGRNGSGKTTVLKLLERFFTPDEGKILYGDENIEDFRLSDWRKSIGYVVQNSPIMMGSIADNIAYGKDNADREEIRSAAEAAGASSFITAMPDGYDTSVGEMGGHISGGQRQKIAIARAIIRDPEIVLLDEADAGLDVSSQKEIAASLRKQFAGRTVVMAAHRPQSIAKADQIIMLDHGEVIASGTHESLLRDCEAYRAFCQEHD